ncbi:MAG TPA: EAL domain-containing protein [Acidiferrobacteraceae bacterium]|nr:EAL domain-containing protein [Acidiferrobacteraceae bacterium]
MWTLGNRAFILLILATIDLGHNLGLSVTAEGVENAEIMDRLQEMGCDTAQGYYLGMPVPLERFIKDLGYYECMTGAPVSA